MAMFVQVSLQELVPDMSPEQLDLLRQLAGKDRDGNYAYTPGYREDNGLYGQFGDVNLEGGSNVTLVFTVTNLNDQPITLTAFDISFFDIDMGHKEGTNSTEAITFHPGWTALHTSSETQLRNITYPDGSVEYRASVFGKPIDSPWDLDNISHWQHSKSVTVHYDNFQSARITLQTYLGEGHKESWNYTRARYFSFVLEPTVLCHNESYNVTSMLGTSPPTTTTYDHSEERRGTTFTTIAASSTVAPATLNASTAVSTATSTATHMSSTTTDTATLQLTTSYTSMVVSSTATATSTTTTTASTVTTTSATATAADLSRWGILGIDRKSILHWLQGV